MPDPLMLSLFAAALLALERWRRSSRPGGFFLALVVSAAAAFVKPVCLPLLWGAFVGLASSGSGLRGTLRSARLWIFVAITLLPAALYFGYGIAVSTQMQDFAGGRFMPHLLLTPAFWKDAAGLALRVAGPSALLASLLGLLLAGRGQGRDLLAGLWIGYGVFVLLFALHTHTHDYYHLLILPPVALGAGYAGASLLAPLAGAARWMRTAASAVLAAGLLIAVDSSRGMLPSWGHEQRVAAYRQTGEAVGHSTECVFLSDAYGLPLQYHGRVAGRYWPTLYDFRWEELTGISQAGASGRLDRLRAAAPVRFFIVTDLAELQRQPELRALLESYPQLPAGESHRIYDLGGGDGEQ